MLTTYLSKLDYPAVISHYNHRVEISTRLQNLLRDNKVQAYINLAVGIENPFGNFSAAEHSLGPRILEKSSAEAIVKLAKQLDEAASDKDVRKLIRAANIGYLKISVGTEMAMLLQQQRHWVANTRSIWSHLMVKHDSVSTANEELKYYRAGAEDSEMAYKLWSAVHAAMECNFQKLGEEGASVAVKKGLQAGVQRYIWADAIANSLYDRYVG